MTQATAVSPDPQMQQQEMETQAPAAKLSGRRLVLPMLLAIGTVLLVLLAAFLLNAASLSSIREAQRLTLQARAQSQAAQDLLLALTDAETGQRGFLLTLKPEYLTPYTQGEARVHASLSRLEQLAVDVPWMQPEIAPLHQSVERKMTELAETLALGQQLGQGAAMDVVRSGRGRADMEAARAALRRIVARSVVEIDRDRELVRAREQRAIRGLVAAAVAGALLLGGAVIALLIAHGRSQGARVAERLQAARLAATVEHLRDGVAVFDASGRLLLSNGHLLANTGWPPGLVRPGAAMADIAAAASGWPNAPLERLRPGAPSRGVETQVDDRVLDVWHSPMPDGGQMLLVSDITRRTQAEAVARQAQKMEVMGQLTGGVAHDFNNLLQVISANLEMIGGRLDGDAWLQARLAAAQAGVERAARLTRHLLAFARRQPLAPQPVDTRALLTWLEEVLRRTLGEHVVIEMVLGGGLWPLRADAQQLESALLNLAINARDAMPEGGKLTIEAANASLDDEYAANNAEVTPGQYVVLAVTDSGLGMTPEQLGRALEPFYTTKPEGKGTGLGLSMVYGFAKQSGGHFKLYSEPGHGTTARLYIPRSLAQARPAEKLTTAAPSAEGTLVLLVEDDAAVRAASVQAVQALGYRVVEATDARSALALIEGGVRPDLLLTDVVMPGKPTARELVARALQLLPGLAVVYTSGYTQNAIVHNGKLDAGVILVSKPWRAAELGRKLDQALRAARSPLDKERALRVLLVEDEMLVRMTTADLLADLGHEVVEVSTGADALASLDGADVLFTDLGLPDMDGLTLASQACARHPGLRVIVASGREAGTETGYTVLSKPYDEAALRAALERAMRGPSGES